MGEKKCTNKHLTFNVSNCFKNNIVVFLKIQSSKFNICIDLLYIF